MSLSRRDFLKLWLSSAILLPAEKLNAFEFLRAKRTKIKFGVEKLLENPEYNKSLKLIWKEQLDFFMKYNSISIENFREKVYKYQSLRWLDKDIVVWDETLDFFYYEISRLKELWDLKMEIPIEIADRIKWQETLNYYGNHTIIDNKWKRHRLENSQIPSLYAKKPGFNYLPDEYFYWEKSLWENKKWTYFNKQLLAELWKIRAKRDWIYVNKTKSWKYYIEVFKNRKLEVLSYVSIGEKRKSQQIVWKNYRNSLKDKNHISSNYWDIMWYGIHIAWSFRIHIWEVNWFEKSHWCVRVPLFYQQKIYDTFKKGWMIFIWKNLYG